MISTVHTVVFSAREGGGNPCPVVLDADGLSAEKMQRMTKEFGQESAFLMRSERPGCDLRARYFVPLHEMEMCIHATIAGITVLVRQERITQSPVTVETILGPVAVEWTRQGDEIEVAVEQFLPKALAANPTPQEVLAALQISPDALRLDWPIRSYATSRQKLIVPLCSREVLDSLTPDFEVLWALCDRYETTGFYPFAAGEEAGKPVFFARQFPKRAGYPEDPATGVASSALGAYLTDTRFLPVCEGWNSYTVYQGFAMGRPSVLVPECFVEAGEITRTRVRGRAALLP